MRELHVEIIGEKWTLIRQKHDTNGSDDVHRSSSSRTISVGH